MTLDELIALQKLYGITDQHLVYIGEYEDGFRIAHTDAERAVANEAPLWKCKLHDWLRSLDEPPVPHGVYTAHMDDSGEYYFRVFT